MENINLITFINYFTDHYYGIIPSVLFLLSLLFAFCDWVRVRLLGWVDDFETTYKGCFIPWLCKLINKRVAGLPDLEGNVSFAGRYSLLSINELDTLKFGGIARGCGGKWLVFVDAYYEFLETDNQQDAVKVSQFVERVSQKELLRATKNPADYFWIGKSKPPVVLLTFFLHMSCLFAILGLHKLLPTFTVVIVTSVASAFVIRKVVRISKKLKAHMADPNAHKPTEVLDE